MNGLTDIVLTTVDRFSSRLGPVNTLVDRILNRIAPHTTARATCSSPYTICSGSVCGAIRVPTKLRCYAEGNCGCFGVGCC